MRDVLGPRTSTVLRLLTDVSGLSEADIEVVAAAWRGNGHASRAAAHTAILREVDPETRRRVHQLAEVVWRRGVAAAIDLRAEHIAFPAAARDAATAVSAGVGAGHDYHVLVGPLANRILWLAIAEPPSSGRAQGAHRKPD